ncbi:hypothetical protein [Aminipila terrae]|uniref:hypothetical protein n=1 Tax=Aminipila terrae TaxID=2697030 RepID=UPI001FAC05C7|nr:hypothetical protein [Aminipila terrae]
MALERHIYPGNNTTEGFYSYYNYILGQREANRIICIKGGPGVGKSTFMRKIGETYLEKGEDVDFMHCSSDNNSLDGVVLKNRRIALIDATSPHVVDYKCKSLYWTSKYINRRETSRRRYIIDTVRRSKNSIYYIRYTK